MGNPLKGNAGWALPFWKASDMAINKAGVNTSPNWSSDWFNKQSYTPSPFSQSAQGQVIDPLTGKLSDMFANWDPSKAQGSFDTGLNHKDLFGGAQGYLDKAGNVLAGDANGAPDWLRSILDPSFTNLEGNPQVQGVLDAMTNQAQRGFNFGADKIASSAAATSSGLGKSTATTDSLSRLNADAQNQLSGTTANFLQSELARRQGLQSGAAGMSLQDRLGMGSVLGQLGMNQSQLGQYVQGQNQMGSNYAMDQFFRLAGLLKNTNSQQNPSPWENFGSVMQTGGQIGGALASMFSDQRVKTNIETVPSEYVDNCMDQITPYEFEYEFDQGVPVFGVMAQDLEKTSMGQSVVIEENGIKKIDIAKATGVLLAMVARLNKRIQELERGIK